jgi:hypothetical protein
MILPQENSFRQIFIAIFQQYRLFQRNLGSLPTTIVLDKYGIMRLHHEGFANYDGEEFNLQIKQLLEE